MDTTTPSRPEIRVDPQPGWSDAETARFLKDTAGRIIRALRRPPHFVVLKGIAPTEGREPVSTLSQLIAITAPTPPGFTRERLMKVSFTQVRINPEKALVNGASTAYSRTNRPLSLHTDSSYQPAPHAMVAFQMVRADPDGGDTVLATVEDIVAVLDPALVETLCQPVFPFGKGAGPVLVRRGDSFLMRYYRNQIDASVEKGAPLSDAARDALDALDMALAGPATRWRFHLASGETLFLHNHKILHGRTGFAPGSTRLMYRYRMHSGTLG